jgi:lipopolysaccharide export LptBFGC system permease protein LptF
MSEECGSCEYNRQCFIKKNVGIFECEKEIVNSEDIQFYEYLGLLEQAYYNTHVGSKAGTIITETIKAYVNILKYKNSKLQQKIEEKDKEITRLNNILDELEKVIQENKFWIYNDVLETRENFEVIDVEYILDKLKKLKEDNK